MWPAAKNARKFLFGFLILFVVSCGGDGPDSSGPQVRPLEGRPESGSGRQQECAALDAEGVQEVFENKISTGDREDIERNCKNIDEDCIKTIDAILLKQSLVARPESYFRFVELN